MKKNVRNIILYLMIGLMQFGVFASISEAAAHQHRNNSPKHGQYDRKFQKKKHDEERRRREHERKIEKGKKGYKHTMRRRPYESRRDWERRKEAEKKNYEKIIIALPAY